MKQLYQEFESPVLFIVLPKGCSEKGVNIEIATFKIDYNFKTRSYAHQFATLKGLQDGLQHVPSFLSKPLDLVTFKSVPFVSSHDLLSSEIFVQSYA